MIIRIHCVIIYDWLICLHFHVLVSNISYNIFDVPVDGNCYFICLSLSIFGNFEKTRSLTNMICSYIIENWQLWEDKVSACHDPRMNLQIIFGIWSLEIAGQLLPRLKQQPFYSIVTYM